MLCAGVSLSFILWFKVFSKNYQNFVLLNWNSVFVNYFTEYTVLTTYIRVLHMSLFQSAADRSSRLSWQHSEAEAATSRFPTRKIFCTRFAKNVSAFSRRNDPPLQNYWPCLKRLTFSVRCSPMRRSGKMSKVRGNTECPDASRQVRVYCWILAIEPEPPSLSLC